MKIATVLGILGTLTLSASTIASPVGGPERADGILLAGGVKAFTLTFRGGEEVMITGVATKAAGDDSDGMPDMDCFLFDSSENLVAKDDDKTNTCFIHGPIIKTATYHLALKNNGSAAAAFSVRAQ